MLFVNIAIGVFALLTALNYRVQRSVLYPPFIFCVMWLIDLSLYRADLTEVDELHGNTIFLLIAGGVLFSAGGLLSLLIPRQIAEIRVDYAPASIVSRVPRYLLLVILMTSLPLIVHDRIQKAAEGTGNSFLERAKSADIQQADEGEHSAGVLSYLVNSVLPMSILTVLVFALEEYDWTFWVAFALGIVITLSSGGRGGILSLLLGVTGIRLIRQHKENLKAAFGTALLPMSIFIFFFGLVIFTVKDVSSFTGIGGILTFFLVDYTIGPVAALDHVVQNPTYFAGPNHTLGFILKPAALLHLTPYTPPPVLDSFIDVPFPTNVYTVYRFFYTDFGALGCLLTISVIGILQSFLYRRAKHRGRLSLVLFALSLFPVVMVIFDDEYYMLSLYFRAIAFCIAYWIASGIEWRVLASRLTVRFKVVGLVSRIRLRGV